MKIMLRCNISILVIQETNHAPTTANNGKYINKTLQKYGLKGFFSDFQYLIYNEAALGARIKDFKSMIGGRIITFQLQIGDVNGKDFINITGCYGAAHGDHKYKPDFKEHKYGHTHNTHRTNVSNHVRIYVMDFWDRINILSEISYLVTSKKLSRLQLVAIVSRHPLQMMIHVVMAELPLLAFGQVYRRKYHCQLHLTGYQ